MTVTLAVGQPHPPAAIRWNTEPVYDGREPARPIRECCRNTMTDGCRVLGAIKSTIFLYGMGNALTITDTIDLMAEEWVDRFQGFWAVATKRDLLSVWFAEGLMHSQPGDFTLGRLAKNGDFIEVGGGELATLYSLDAYRSEK